MAERGTDAKIKDYFFYFIDESTKKLRYRNELQREMNQLVEEFFETMQERYTALIAKHSEERTLVKREKKRGEIRRSGARDGSAVTIEDLTKDRDGEQRRSLLVQSS